MLTTSPIIPSSANASPTRFRYGPARSPQSSPSRLSGSLPRRQPGAAWPSSPASITTTSASVSGTTTTTNTNNNTTTAITISAHSRPRQYVGVDASTQYSPMDGVKTNNDSPTAREEESATALSSSSGSQSIADAFAAIKGLQIEKKSEKQQSQPSQSETDVSAPSETQEGPTKTSPTKRRKSADDDAAGPTTTSTEEAESSKAVAKRLRPAEAPPKVLPLRYEHCDVDDLVVLIARMLSELIETNDSLALRSGSLTRFHSRTAPGISVSDYLSRLAKHATLTPPLLLSMVYYIDRLCALYPEFTINTLTVHRFLITAATVAAKGLSDSFWNNSTYARVGGVRVAELKLLELEFLYRVDWKIVPNPEVLVAYYRGLVERCPGYVLEAGAAGSATGPESSSSSLVEDGEYEIDESDEAEEEVAGR